MCVTGALACMSCLFLFALLLFLGRVGLRREWLRAPRPGPMRRDGDGLGCGSARLVPSPSPFGEVQVQVQVQVQSSSDRIAPSLCGDETRRDEWRSAPSTWSSASCAEPAPDARATPHRDASDSDSDSDHTTPSLPMLPIRSDPIRPDPCSCGCWLECQAHARLTLTRRTINNEQDNCTRSCTALSPNFGWMHAISLSTALTITHPASHSTNQPTRHVDSFRAPDRTTTKSDMRAVRTAGAALLALLALAPAALPVAAQTSQPGRAPLSLAALLSPQEQFPVPKPSRPFLCENAGFLREHLPLSFVADGVCDCCDGSDERVAEGAHPFFASKGGAEQPQQAEADAGSGSGSGWGWSLLGGSGGGSGSGGSDGAATDASPCPNTCASLARDFLSAMEKRVDEYAAGVDAKNKRVRGVKAVRARLAKEAKAMQAALAATAEAFRAAQAALQQGGGGGGGDRDAGVATLRRLQHQGNQLQSDLEQTRWFLGQAVPSPHDRRTQRAAGTFGAQNEWLLLIGRCFDYAWPQRRFGAFGEHVDWYLMQLCPLANATQSAWSSAAPLPPREGSGWREGATVPVPADPTIARTSDAATSDVAVSEQQQAVEEEEEEPQQWSLGWWTGEIVSQQQEDSDAAAATLPFIPATGGAAAAAGGDPPGSVRSSTPDPSFLLPLRDGEPCWQVGPRQVDVEFRCGRVDEIVSVVEDGKCRYRMGFATPLACQRDHLALLRQQLEEHRRWFQRRHPKPTPPPTLEQLLHDEL